MRECLQHNKTPSQLNFRIQLHLFWGNWNENRCNGETKAPKTGMYCKWWPQTVAFFLSFLNDSYLVLCSACVLVTTGSMRWYLQTNQVTQVVQLRQNGTCGHKKVCSVSQHSLKSIQEIPGDWLLHEKSWTGLRRALTPAAGLVSAPLYDKEHEDHCQSPTKWPPAGHCMFLTKLPETYSIRVAWEPYVTAPCSLIIRERTPELAPESSLYIRASSHWYEHM